MSTPTLKSDIRTRHLLAFEDIYQKIDPSPVGTTHLAVAAVKTAISAGWFENGAKPEDVDELTPRETIALSKAINDFYSDAVNISPNS